MFASAFSRAGSFAVTGALFVAPLSAQAWELCSPLHSFQGEEPADNFGWIVDSIADLDGDGKMDAIITAPFSTQNGPNSGRVYVHSSGSGELLHRFDGQSGENLGNHAAGISDLDGDGLAEILVGAPGTGTLPGAVYVFSGLDGSLLTSFSGEAPGDRFGQVVDRAGDVDGDGVEDILVGAPNHDSGGSNAGRAYLYSGATGAVISTWTGSAAGDMLGTAVGPAGDRNQDGFADYLVGARGAGVGGEAFLVDGASGTAACQFFGEAGSGGNYARAFLQEVGDVNADGTTDFFITDWSNNNVVTGGGKAFVYSGLDCSLLHTFAGDQATDNFGGGHAGVGDVDGDGHDDLAFCAWSNDDGGANAGKVLVYSGASGAELGRYTGDVAGAWFGSDLVGLGDVDDDGRPDYLISAAWIPDSQPGTAFIVSSAPAPPRSLCVSGANSSGSEARMTYRRSTSLADDDFRLRVEGAVPSQTGVFFFGNQEANAPFGDGTLCIAGGLTRIGAPVTLSAGGSKQIPLDFSAAPFAGVLAAGQATLFQFWYRDPAAGGAGFNLSDALAVTWCP